MRRLQHKDFETRRSKILTLEDFDISRFLDLKMFRFCVLEAIFGVFRLVCCVVSHAICNSELIFNDKPMVLMLFGCPRLATGAGTPGHEVEASAHVLRHAAPGREVEASGDVSKHVVQG